MKIPDRNRHWKKEIEKALASAEKRAEKEGLERESLYKYAVDYITKNRGISDDALVREVAEQIEADIKYSREVDPDSRLNFRFGFVSSYLYGHATAGVIDEIYADKILDYISRNMDLFHPDYHYE